MKEKPILFKPEMVRAVLNGTKTQTRRIIKGVPRTGLPGAPRFFHAYEFEDDKGRSRFGFNGGEDYLQFVCPYGNEPIVVKKPTEPGWYYVKWDPSDTWGLVWIFDGCETWGFSASDDPESIALDVDMDEVQWKKPSQLWVRETWRTEIHSDGGGPWRMIRYRATDTNDDCLNVPYVHSQKFDDMWDKYQDRVWRPSIYMPRWASRIQLTIKDVRVERVLDISEEDAKSEGVFGDPIAYGDQHPTVNAFCDLWNSINAAPKPVKSKGKITHYVSYPYEDIQETREHKGLPWHVIGNPYVWRVQFEVING